MGFYGDELFIEATTNMYKTEKGITYRYHTSQEVDSIAKKAAEIIKEYLKKLYSSPEWKEIKNKVKETNNKYSGFKKMPSICYELQESYKENRFLYSIQTDPYWLSQDTFYAEYAPGKHVYNIMDKIYKELASDSRVKKLPNFSNTSNGDDYACWCIILELNFGTDVTLKEG